MLSRAADYAVRAMVHLAGLDAGTRAAQHDIAAVIDVPSTFTGKVLQRLVAADLVASRRGKGGGFTITARGRQSSMYDVVVAIAGEMPLNECLSVSHRCRHAPGCAAHRVWGMAQSQVVGVLRAAKISELATENARVAAVAAARSQDAEPVQVICVAR